jgi:PTH1 family peptidyl-tRNA hydrolase
VRLIVGLGNPGVRYRRTRHNVGFMVADALAAEAGGHRWYEEADALVAEVTLGGGNALLVKPQTFMNRSGLAVAQLVEAQGAASSEVMVIVDDVAIELGTLRIRERGGHGGHNGLRSIIEQLGKPDFLRVRIGVGKGPSQKGDAASWVLADFQDDAAADELCGKAADAVEVILGLGVTAAMNQFNGTLARGKSAGTTREDN